jgi:hypothetical protein
MTRKRQWNGKVCPPKPLRRQEIGNRRENLSLIGSNESHSQNQGDFPALRTMLTQPGVGDEWIVRAMIEAPE